MLVALILILASILIAPLIGAFCGFNDREPSNDTFQDNPDRLGGVNLNFHDQPNNPGGQHNHA